MSIKLDEEHYVENDFLKHLKSIGYRIYRQDKNNPEITYEIVGFDENNEAQLNQTNEKFRESFSEVLLLNELKNSLKRINGFLDDSQVEEVIRKLENPSGNSLITINREIHELLTQYTSVSEDRKTKEKSPTVKYIDFKNPENNSFIAISQFKITIPGTEKYIIPDIVIFVNGIPLVVVECKSPTITEPIYEAIEQLLRYSERRGSKEGNRKLFYYNAFQIATMKTKAVMGTITSGHEHFVEWLDPYPFAVEDNLPNKKDHKILIQGALSKQNLLDLVYIYTIFKDNEHGTSKIVARYNQFRAVKKILEQIRKGKNPKEKGGIIWHTQGSGKSLTMLFTVRELYANEDEFGDYKIVFITDRRDLQRQLQKETLSSLGYKIKVAESIKHLQELLKTNTPEVILGMINKFNETEAQEKFPILNTSSKILIMIDEAHRSEYKELGANLHYSLPNSIKIAFTGTPIDKTEITFGDYIDTYTIKQSVEDGVTVPIIYEGRAITAEIKDKEEMDRKFEDVFRYVDQDERKLIMGKYTWLAYLENRSVIRDKARDMINHYVEKIFKNGFKAQVVVASRNAAVLYKEALTEALKEKIKELEKNNPNHIDIEKLKKLKIAVIISGTLNDEEKFKQYTDPKKQEREIESFKLPFGETKDGIEGDVGIIVVDNMLITGFDAPIEQVMYLDKVLKDHNLLQAIARVNRVYKNKSAGFVVDYVGIFNHLKEALANYFDKDTNEIFKVVFNKDEAKSKLKEAYEELINFFKKMRIDNFTKEIESCIDILLLDEEKRNEFYDILNRFNRYMDILLPDPYAVNFSQELKTANFIRESLRNTLREGPSIKENSNKVREIVEEHLVSKGVVPKIAETNLLDENFITGLASFSTLEQQAIALEVATRNYIKEHYPEDPELYERFSKKLEEILTKYEKNWEEIKRNLMELRKQIKEGRSKEVDLGLDKRKEMPFFGILLKEIYGGKRIEDLAKEERDFLIKLTRELCKKIEENTKKVDFWENSVKQKELRVEINNILLINSPNISNFQGVKETEAEYITKKSLSTKYNTIAQQIIETAYHIFRDSHGRN